MQQDDSLCKKIILMNASFFAETKKRGLSKATR